MAYTDLDRLTRIFSAVLGPLLATSACGGRIDEGQFTIDVCSDQGLDILATVEPTSPVDFLELREVSYEGEGFASIDAAGKACAAASDAEACAAALAALPTDSMLYAGGGSILDPSHHVLAYTRGDEVAAITDVAGLRAFLGDIDSPGDAALLGVLTGHRLRCEEDGEVGEHADGYVLYTTSGTGCGRGNDVEHNVVLVRRDGTMSVIDSKRIERGDPGCATGRLPPGLCRPRAPSARGPVGAFFAEVAHLEAASAPAFAQLAGELALHGAPAPLIHAAIRARDDEHRHARATARLARRFGARAVAPRVQPTPPRSLLATLADNAAEGCVRETYGALVAHVQARRARDPQVRRTLARIAGDETRHAALSWSLARWARARMNVGERRHLARSTAHAFDRFERELLQSQHPQVHALAGLPEPAEASSLFTRLRAALLIEASA